MGIEEPTANQLGGLGRRADESSWSVQVSRLNFASTVDRDDLSEDTWRRRDRVQDHSAGSGAGDDVLDGRRIIAMRDPHDVVPEDSAIIPVAVDQTEQREVLRSPNTE